MVTAADTSVNRSDPIGLWNELVAKGSIRGAREISWPIARYIKKSAAVQAAVAQHESGFATQRHPAFSVKPPVAWGANPYRSKEWRNRLMWMQPLDVYFHAYESSGDDIWLSRFVELFLDWSTYHRNLTQVAYGTWGDMNVGFRALKLAYIVDMAVSGACTPSNEDIPLLVWAIDAHLEVLLREEELSEGNHGIFQLHGLKVLSSVAWNRPYSTLASPYIKKHQKRLLQNQFSSEGVHLEHSAKYHWWMARILKDLIDSGWYERDEVEWSSQTLNLAEEIKIWMTAPDGVPILSGDSKERLNVGAMSTTNETPDYSGPSYRFRWLPQSGYASCRSGDALLFFSAAYHSGAHKHSDNLHFDLYDNGVPILIDCGSCNNDPGKVRSYQVGTSSHNTIQVDDENLPYRGEEAFGSALKGATCHEFGISLSANVNYHALRFSHNRVLGFIPGFELCCRDEVESEIDRTVKQWFHFDCRWKVIEEQPLKYILSDGTFDLIISCVGADSSQRYYGQTTPALQGWRMQNGVLKESNSICMLKRGKSVKFETKIAYSSRNATLGDKVMLFQT